MMSRFHPIPIKGTRDDAAVLFGGGKTAGLQLSNIFSPSSSETPSKVPAMDDDAFTGKVTVDSNCCRLIHSKGDLHVLKGELLFFKEISPQKWVIPAAVAATTMGRVPPL